MLSWYQNKAFVWASCTTGRRIRQYKKSHGRSSIVVIFLSHYFTFANTSIKLPYELQASSEVRDE